MHSTVALFGVFILSTIICKLKADCLTGWIQFENSCYMFSNDEERWVLAEASCMAHDARLAEIYDKRHDDFLRHKLARFGHEVWIGGRDDVVEGLWQWASTGQNFNYTNWGPGKPNDFLGEDCITMDDDYNYQWNDRDCHFTFRYVCERRFSNSGQGIIG